MTTQRQRLIGVLTIRWMSLLVDGMCSVPPVPAPPFRGFMAPKRAVAGQERR